MDVTFNFTTPTDVSTLATQTTLAAILSKIIAAPSTAAGQATTDTAIGLVARESGGNLAAVKADLDSLLTAVATAAKQDTGNTSLATLASSLGALVTANHTDLTALHTDLAAIFAKQPSTPALEGGNLASIKADLDTLLTTVATAASQATIVTALGTLHTDSAAILAKQPAAPALESGHLATIDTATTAGAASLVSILAKLIAAPATAALQGGGLPSALISNRLDVNIGASGATVPTSSALGSTVAAQTTGNASLASIDGKAPALGQALAPASVPVVLTAVQVAQLAQDASVLARCLLGQGVTAAARTIVNPSDYTIRVTDSPAGGASWIDLGATTITPSGTTPQLLIAAGTNRRVRLILPLFNQTAGGVNVAVFNGNSGSSVWGTYTNLIDYFAMSGAVNANVRDYQNVGKACPLGVYILISTTAFNGSYTAAGSPAVFSAIYI